MNFVIIDNGHGDSTPGKRSPDGRLREWQWTRRMARALSGALAGCGVHAELLVPGDGDVPVAQRCRMVNGLCDRYPGAVLVSLHTNAAGDGSRWQNASGWSVFVAERASEQSDRLAALMSDEARARQILGNRATPACGFWTARWPILSRTLCPAVLTENMFHDNTGDVDFLLSDEGFSTILDVHLSALSRYFGLS